MPRTNPNRATKPEWRMSAVELARVFADRYGWCQRGTWIRDADDRPVALGWDMLADRLLVRGWIVVGAGVNWTRAGTSPSLPPPHREGGHYVD